MGLLVEPDLVRDIANMPFVFLGEALPRLIFPAYPLFVFGDDAIRLRDAENKRVAMIFLNLLNSRTVEYNPISADACDAWPMHGSEAGRPIPHLLEDLSPIARHASREPKWDSVQGAAPRTIIPWLSYLIRYGADDSDRVVRRLHRLRIGSCT